MSFGSLPSVLGNGGGVAISVIGGTGLFADGTAAAPSISFAAQTTTGFFRAASGQIAFSSAGTSSLQFAASGQIVGSAGQCVLQLGTNGQIALTAGGTAQNITLTPSGTGFVQIGGTVNGQLRLYDSSNVEQVRMRVDGNASFFAIGSFLFGTGTDSNNGRLQLATHTTSAGGIGFGTDFSFYRQTATQITISNAGQEIVSFYKVGAGMKLEVNGGTVASPQIAANGDGDTGIYWALGNDLRLVTGGIAALTLDTSQRTILSGALRLANAYVAGAVVGTGYVTIQDSTGTTYRVPVLV